MLSTVALTDLVGRRTRDVDGNVLGTLHDLVVVPQDHPTRVAYLVVRARAADLFIPTESLASISGGVIRLRPGRVETVALPADSLLLLQRDLLDQQIIDVEGRKVVRVNDVELDVHPDEEGLLVDVRAVDVGSRGALRRLGKGLIPRHTLRALLARIPSRLIAWDFVDLVESDPARRVKLKIAYQGLSTLHPADIADIVEELPRAQREGVFETLDDEVAAGALEELDPRTQVAVLASLDKDRAADIVEEMEPDAAADLLGDLPEAHSGAILQEMEPAERQHLTTLLEFGEHTAAGRMTTECLILPSDARVGDVAEAIRRFHGDQETLTTVFVIGDERELVGAVPISRTVIADRSALLAALSAEPLVSCHIDAPEDEVVELFDKYNLLALPVVDEHGRLAGVITADDIINLLRREH
ncbi:MAG TPA: CBS domain-containing protein [Vicinamibacterales bacterium]|jgi:flagellar motility protein MotE (MotC chaperone)/sporulation protein YlmC with PRC-barrel domain|nr:CBS domain-containing protein [Vicinamibacterales bacterium]